MSEDATESVLVEKAGEEEPEIPETVGILPIRGLVIFPRLTIPLTIGRKKSLKLIDEVLPGEEKIFGVLAVRPEAAEKEDPGPEDLFDVGCAVRVLRMAKVLPDRYQIIVYGLSRIRVEAHVSQDPYFTARVAPAPEETATGPEMEAMVTNLKNQFKKWAEIKGAPAPMIFAVEQEEGPLDLVYLVTAQLGISAEEQQQILEMDDLGKKVRRITEHVTRERERLSLAQEIQDKIKEGLEKGQREYLLREQMKMIQEELGEKEPQEAEADELRKRVEEADLPPEAETVAERELSRLARIPPAAAEYSVARTYLDWIVDLPWKQSTEDVLDLDKAEAVLDEDHYDLEKIKKRILEYLAVRKLKKDMRGPILCFAGPPGTGKTSLGQSIARALGRKFIRMSLGGIHDEAEIRGHRRTYVGALPGRILQGLKKVGTNNPVFMLDEVDKIGADFRGDPSSALLEVLDPEQNFSFSDNYLEIPFDLSRVMFITTANVLYSIPPPLLDRMEVLELAGYTDEEKLHIARRYLLPRQIEENGLTEKHLSFSDDALRTVIHGYTREAGVRNLEREVAAVCRGVATRVASGKTGTVKITGEKISDYLGPEKFLPEMEIRRWGPGLATGLAWTPVGGELLFIEASKMPGNGGFTLTGKLGDVMKESANAAFSHIKSRAPHLDLDQEDWETKDLHVHVPAGAIPKDGPSAGLAMLSALASALVEKPVDKKLAMTGEVTLRGDVLPVGGIKEKILAAHRAGLRTVILPERNRKDLVDIPDHVKNEMEFVFVNRMEEVLARAIPRMKIDLEKALPKTRTASGKSAGKKKNKKKSAAKKKGKKKTTKKPSRKKKKRT